MSLGGMRLIPAVLKIKKPESRDVPSGLCDYKVRKSAVCSRFSAMPAYSELSSIAM